MLLHLAILVPLALALFTFRLGDTDWKDAVQANSGQIVQEIDRGEGWILPLQNERHIPVKPPLFYWLGALSARLRGSGGELLDARLPSAVLGTLTMLVVYAFARSLAGPQVALWSAVILITSPQFFSESRNSRVDIALCFFLTSALFLAYRATQSVEARWSALIAGLCIGLATLSKGPLAIGLAALVLGLSALISPGQYNLRVLLSPWSVLLAIGVPALWYVAAAVEHGTKFFEIHFYAENVSRLLGEQGRWPFWFYAEPLLTAGLPWILALPWVMRGQSALPPRSRRLLWVWIVAMLVFFSLSPGKRRAYLLPLRPALAVLVAGWIVPALARVKREVHARPPRWIHAAIGALALGAFAGVLVLRSGAGGFGAADEQWSYWWRLHLEQHLETFAALILGTALGTALMIRWAWQRRLDLAGYALAALLAWNMTIIGSSVRIVQGEGGSFRPFAQRLQAVLGPSDQVAFLGYDDRQAAPLLFHLHRHISVVSGENGALCAPPWVGQYLIQEARWDQESCFRNPAWKMVARGGPAVRSQRWRRLVLARYAGPPGS